MCIRDSVKVGIVAARFNEFITSKLLSGAMDGLLRHAVQDAAIHVAWVPGAVSYTHLFLLHTGYQFFHDLHALHKLFGAGNVGFTDMVLLLSLIHIYGST